MDAAELNAVVAELNARCSFAKELDYEALAQVALNAPREEAERLLAEVEQKASSVKDPTAWVTSALRKLNHSSAIDIRVKKRVEWLNTQGGFDGALNEEKVLEATRGRHDDSGIMRVLKDVEQKKDEVKDPTAYVTSAIRKIPHGQAIPGSVGPVAQWGGAQRSNVPGAAAWTGDVATEDAKLRKRIGWLNHNGFEGKLNYSKILEAAGGLEFSSVFNKLKQLEEHPNRAEINDPSGWIAKGLKNEAAKMGQQQWAGAPAPAWGAQPAAPAWGGPPGAAWGAPPAAAWGGPAPQQQWTGDVAQEDQKLRKKIGWLNKNGFDGKLHYQKILEAAGGLEFSSVFRILQQLEENPKRAEINDPSGWVAAGLKKEAAKQGQQQWAAPPAQNWAPAGYGGPAPMDVDATSKLHKRCTWLNGKGGFDGAIVIEKVQEAVGQTGAALGDVLNVLKELEEKKDEVKNPTAYVTSALRKAGGKGGGKGKSAGVPMGGPPMGVKRTIMK